VRRTDVVGHPLAVFAEAIRGIRTSRSRQGRSATRIERTILLIRGERVLPDADLAALHGLYTGALVRAVECNTSRFPADFMFHTDWERIP